MKLTNHREARYLAYNDGTAYRGTIQLPRPLFEAVIQILLETEGWWYQGHTEKDAKDMLKADARPFFNGLTRASIRVNATQELVRILKLKNYKPQNYIIEVV